MKKTVSKKVKVSEEHIQELQKNLKKVRTAALKSPTGLLNKVGNLPDKDLIEMVLKVMLRGNSHDVALSTLISHEREKSPKRILSDLKFDMDSLTIPITFSAQGASLLIGVAMKMKCTIQEAAQKFIEETADLSEWSNDVHHS